MKKHKFIRFLFLLIMLISINTPIKNFSYAQENTTINMEIQQEENISEWLNNEVMPALISLGVSLIAIFTAFQPFLKGITNGIVLFKNSKGEYDKTTQRILETQKQINDFNTEAINTISSLKNETINEISCLKAEIILTNSINKEQLSLIQKEMIDKLKSLYFEIENSKKEIETLREILKIGFGNNAELVKNGYAREIMKVVNNGSSETKKEDNNITTI